MVYDGSLRGSAYGVTMTNDILYGAVGFLAAFVVNAAWDWIKDKKKTQEDEFRAELKENTKAVHQLTLVLQRTEIELKHLADKVISIPEIEKDLNKLGAKVRRMDKSE